MTLLKRNTQMEGEFSLLSEMDMLHVYGGDGDTIISNSGCSLNFVAGCGASSSGSHGGSSSAGSSSGSTGSGGSGSSAGHGSGGGTGNGNANGSNIAIVFCKGAQ